MEASKYVYSIIIPHHNIPLLLKRCLDSIPLRDDIQVIVVDDKSSDETLSVLKEMEAARPSCTFIYMDKNGGGGKARNVGLHHAQGRFVIFADADDFFNECLSSVLDDYQDTDYDIIYFKGNSVDTNTLEPANRADHLNRYIDAHQQGEDSNGEQLRYLFGEPWARIIKRSMIEQYAIRFDETFIHNDTAFGYLTGYHARAIHSDSRALYCVTVRQGSVSVTDSIDRILTRVAVFGRAERFLTEHHIHTCPDAHYKQLVHLLVHGQLRLLNRCTHTLQAQHLSRAHIYAQTISTFFRIVNAKFKNTTAS